MSTASDTVAVLWSTAPSREACARAAAHAVVALTRDHSPVRFRLRPGRRPLCSQAGRRLWVSWSHAGSGVAAAASTRPVGVDVEQCREVRAAPVIDARLTRLGLAGSVTRCCLLGRWCAVEATLKSLGTGFALPLERLAFRGPLVHLDRRATGLHRTPALLAGARGHHHAGIVHHAGHLRLVRIDHTAGTSPEYHLGSALPGIPAPSTTEEDMTVALDKEELRTIVADTIDQDLADVTDTASFVDDLDVDSLMSLELMIVLERKYGVKLKEEMLPQVTTMQAAYDLLSSELAKSE